MGATAVDIRPLLTQGGTYSYANGGIVLSSSDHADRRRVAQQMIPHSIAMVVHVLNRAAERLAMAQGLAILGACKKPVAPAELDGLVALAVAHRGQ